MFCFPYKRIGTVLLAVLLLISLIGCSSGGAPSESEPSSEASVDEIPTASSLDQDEDDGKKTISYAVSEIPQTVDPAAVSASSLSAEFVYNTSEGLLRYYNNQIVPGMAESWDTDDNITFTFHLRSALWEDGMSVTANDAAYSLKRVLNPESGAVLSDGLLLIRNASAYRAGNVGSDELGITVVDEKTLEITLEEASPYFLEALAADTRSYFVREDIVFACKDTFATGTGTYLSCGPFRIAGWEEDRIVLEKNEMYWNESNIKAERIVCRFVPDGATRAVMYAAGECNAFIELLDSNNEVYEQPKTFTTNTLVSLVLNANSDSVSGANMKKALSCALDKNALVSEKISGTAAADRFAPDIVFGANYSYFSSTSVESSAFAYNKDQAKTALDAALKDLDMKSVSELGEIVLLCSDNPVSKALAENLVKQWREVLGMTKIRIDALSTSEMLDKYTTGSYDIYLQTTIGGITDPFAQLSLYDSHSLYGWSNWKDETYDNLLAEANMLTDTARYEQLAEAEQYLIDHGPVIPLYFRGGQYGFDSTVSGVGISSAGVCLQLIYADVKK